MGLRAWLLLAGPGCLADHRQHNQPREEHEPMSIVVTGATGQLGRLVVEALLQRGVPAEQIIATGRRTEVLGDLADRGVVVRRADFNDQASLPEAFAGADKLLLVSGSQAGQRVRQHGNAINAAKAAGVGCIAYTSGVRANTSTLLANQDHRATEQLLAEAGVPHARLRNCWYLENYTGQLPVYLERGIVGAAGAGTVSAATRADYAEAAAAVLAGEGHAGAVYELGGEPFTMAELAEVISVATGQTVTYTDLPVKQYQALLVGAGLPEEMAAMVADGDRGVAAGELLVEGDDLKQLLGREPTPLADAVAAAVADLRGWPTSAAPASPPTTAGGGRPGVGLAGGRFPVGAVGRVEQIAGGPRFTGRWRNDKAPEDATRVEEVVSIFRTAPRAPTSA
jgi:NAD(P)H dehydrogenase (quinone)